MFSLHAQSVSTVSALRNCRANSRVNRCDALLRVRRDFWGANFSFFFLWEISLLCGKSSRKISRVALFLFLRFVRPKRWSRGPLSERWGDVQSTFPLKRPPEKKGRGFFPRRRRKGRWWCWFVFLISCVRPLTYLFFVLSKTEYLLRTTTTTLTH